MNTKRNEIPIGFSIGVGLISGAVLSSYLRVVLGGDFDFTYSVFWVLGSLGVGLIALDYTYERE